MQRQIDREGAAHIGRAAKLDLTAKKVRQLSGDCEPKSGAAIFAAGARIGLLERLEDDLLFRGSNTDARVRYLERNDLGCLIQNGVARAPAFRHRLYLEPNPALLGKLESVGRSEEHTSELRHVEISYAV